MSASNVAFDEAMNQLDAAQKQVERMRQAWRQSVAENARLKLQLLIATECEAAEAGEHEALRAQVVEYENSINWGTSCLSCSKTLDASYDAHMRWEQLRDAVAALAARWERESAGAPTSHTPMFVGDLRALLPQPAPPDVDEMCPNCVTPWKCNGPHELPGLCHCGQPVVFGYDGDPTHHRGMCEHCDAVRCDAYPGDCKR